MHTPTVSVVIPMYNVERYIEQSVSSVLNQTFEDFELICVDDGSSDRTFFKLKQFDDDRIRIVMQENKGLAGARNTGINAARGEFVALLDADDFWAPEKLEHHVFHLRFNPDVGISYSPSWFVNENGEPMGFGQFPKLRNITTKDIFCRNPIGNGSAPVIRRSLLQEMSENINTFYGERTVCFNESLRQSEDIEFWLRVALREKWRIEGIDAPLTFYRVNSSGLSANLEKQFQSWEKAVELNQKGNEAFFERWYSLAKAYQYRYLARRAVQSGNAKAAMDLVNQALACNIRILFEEPGRTSATYLCALLSRLPKKVYQKLESIGMALLSKKATVPLTHN